MTNELIKKLANMKPKSVLFFTKDEWAKHTDKAPVNLIYQLSRNKSQQFYGKVYGTKKINEDIVIIRGRK